MLSFKSTRVLVMTLAFGVLSLGVSAQTNLPTVKKSGTVEYLSGGIGSDESQAIEAASRQWPLTLEFAASTGAQRGEFIADVRVSVRDSTGQVALQTTSSGPFLLIKLPPGRYEIDATYAGKTEHRSVTVAQGQPVRSVFSWPG